MGDPEHRYFFGVYAASLRLELDEATGIETLHRALQDPTGATARWSASTRGDGLPAMAERAPHGRSRRRSSGFHASQRHVRLGFETDELAKQSQLPTHAYDVLHDHVCANGQHLSELAGAITTGGTGRVLAGAR